MNVLIIVGSATMRGRTRALAEWFAERLRAQNPKTSVNIIDLADVAFIPADGRPLDAYETSIRDAVERVAASDGVLFTSPVYRGTYTGVLKNFLDIVPLDALYRKPVGVAVVGATPNHYLGVDLALRAVLAWFGAVSLPTSVYLTPADFDEFKHVASAAEPQLEALLETLVRFAAACPGVVLGPRPFAASSRR